MYLVFNYFQVVELNFWSILQIYNCNTFNLCSFSRGKHLRSLSEAFRVTVLGCITCVCDTTGRPSVAALNYVTSNYKLIV